MLCARALDRAAWTVASLLRHVGVGDGMGDGVGDGVDEVVAGEAGDGSNGSSIGESDESSNLDESDGDESNGVGSDCGSIEGGGGGVDGSAGEGSEGDHTRRLAWQWAKKAVRRPALRRVGGVGRRAPQKAASPGSTFYLGLCEEAGGNLYVHIGVCLIM